MTYPGLNLIIHGNAQKGFVVYDKDTKVLGTIDCNELGPKIPVFKPIPEVCRDGISSDFLLEIGTAMTVISREELTRQMGVMSRARD